MRVRTTTGLLGLLAGLSGVAAAAAPSAPPTWLYGHDLRVRTGGAGDFDKGTPKVGVEVFKDNGTGALVAVTQTGALAVTTAGPAAGDKKAAWLYGYDLRARRFDEPKFTKDTAKFGVEAFRDGESGKLLYACEKGTVAFADPPPSPAATDKGPAALYGLIVKARGPAEEQFTKDTRRYGVEVIRDDNTGGLLYVSETGSVAAAPAPPRPPADPVKAPEALYGLTVRIRKAGEKEFTKDTRRYGVEVFRDDNTGGLLYVSETGSVAAAPAPPSIGAGKGIAWRHAMELKARPSGVGEFAKATKFAVEVFLDNNTGHTVYVSETGAIAVLPAPK